MTYSVEGSKPPTFTQEELARALKEQSFGINSYEIVSTTPLKATASVVLLEGQTILVSLSSRGFQVRHSIPRVVRIPALTLSPCSFIAPRNHQLILIWTRRPSSRPSSSSSSLSAPSTTRRGGAHS